MDSQLQLLLRQESELQFTEFTNDTALALGLKLVEAAQARSCSVTVDVCRNGQQLFHCALPGTSADNDDWIKRKTSSTAMDTARSTSARSSAPRVPRSRVVAAGSQPLCSARRSVPDHCPKRRRGGNCDRLGLAASRRPRTGCRSSARVSG